MDAQDLDRQIAAQRAAVEQARRQAEAAERERQAHEQAPQRAVQQAEAELVRLEAFQVQQAQQLQYQRYVTFVSEISTQVKAVVAALENRDLTAAQAAWGGLLAAHATAVELHQAGVRAPVWTPEEKAAYQRLLHDPATINDALTRHIQIELYASQHIDAARAHLQPLPLPPVPGVWDLLAAWVQRAPNDMERRWRQGLLFCVSGRVIGDGGPGFSAVGTIIHNSAPRLMR